MSGELSQHCRRVGRQVATPMRSWRCVGAVWLSATAVAWAYEYATGDPENFQYLATALMGFYGTVLWLAVGLGLAVTYPWRRNHERVELAANVVVVIVLIVEVLAAAVFLVAFMTAD